MNREYHKWFSLNVGKEMELLIHGHAGIPMMIFPCSNGRFYDFEDRRMFDTVSNLIEEGKVIFYSVDGLDWETWHNYNDHPSVGANRHEDYDNYIIQEVVPFISGRNTSGKKIFTGGASMGAYHAVNFYFRHPKIFGGTIAMSGNYHIREFFGDYMDENVYYNSPLAYLPNLSDTNYLERYKTGEIIICVGQGVWEDSMLRDTLELREILRKKQIPAFIDIWGHDVNHDWPWWEKQFPIFIDMIVNNKFRPNI